jgi:predicted porin
MQLLKLLQLPHKHTRGKRLMKKSAIVLSVATILAAPFAMAGEITGSLRYGLVHTTEGDGDTSLQDQASRIKAKGDIDLGNGLTGLASYELRFSDSRNGNIVNRLYSVGLKGDFGSFEMGVIDTAYDLSTSEDSWWSGYHGLLGNRNEKNGGFVYTKTADSVTFALGGQMDPGDADNDALDLVDMAVRYSDNGLTLAAGVQELTGSKGTATNLTAGYDSGDWNARITLGTEDEDYAGGAKQTGINIQAFMGNMYVWYGSVDVDGGNTPTSIGVGYSHSLGPKTLVWAEAFSFDPDSSTEDSYASLRIALKRDF